jgi:outer membrane protein assembly factor BamB
MDGPTAAVSRDLTSGAVRWQTPAPFTAHNTNFQLLRVDGPTKQVVALVSGKDLTAYDAIKGTIAWRFSLPSSAVLDGVAVVGGGLVLQASGCKYRVVHRGSGPC